MPSFLPRPARSPSPDDDASSGYSDFDEPLSRPPTHDDLPRTSSSSEGGYVGPGRMTMDTELGRENVGYGLLKKMGWKGEGQGLGVEGDGQSSLSS